mgnify:CR=1 FL=1
MIKTKLKIQKNVSLAPYTTFDIGGQADFFIKIKSEKELTEIISQYQEKKLPVLVLGGGSNLLIADQGFRGIVIKIENKKYQVNKTEVETEAGLPLAELVTISLKNNLSGLESCWGIPGTIGGAIHGNAGSKEQGIGQVIKNVTTINSAGQKRIYPKSECQFHYRQSLFQNNQEIILKAIFNLKKSSRQEIQTNVDFFKQKRAPQPAGKSAGSIFKNPPHNSAGRLIDQAGLKGKTIGQAQISPKHANFIINLGGAKSHEVLELIKMAQKAVWRQFQIRLQLEIALIGFSQTIKDSIIRSNQLK